MSLPTPRSKHGRIRLVLAGVWRYCSLLGGSAVAEDEVVSPAVLGAPLPAAVGGQCCRRAPRRRHAPAVTRVGPETATQNSAQKGQSPVQTPSREDMYWRVDSLWVYSPGVFVCLPLLVARVHRVLVLVEPHRPPVDPLQIGLTR